MKSLEHQTDLSNTTLRTIIHAIPLLEADTPTHSRLMLVMDCVYFGRGCCYLVVRDWYKRKNIYVKRLFKGYETIADYLDAVCYIESLGNTIDGIVVDGRRGVILALEDMGYMVQMCQFHMKQIIKRHLTNNPQTEAGITLKELTNTLTHTTQDIMSQELNNWHSTHELFLKEKTISPDGKNWTYTHRRVRSAYYSIKRNLPNLFTFQKTKNMPNTTNSADGYFAHLKDKVRIHRGLRRDRKHRLITYLIVRS